MTEEINRRSQKSAHMINYLICAIFLFTGLAGCRPATPLQESATPSQTSASLPATPQPATATSSPTPASPVTPTASSGFSRQINPQNAAAVTALAKLGRGMLDAAPFYSADGQLLLIPTTIGVDVYDAMTLKKVSTILSIIDEGVSLFPAYPRLVALSSDSRLLAANLNLLVFSPDGKFDENSIGKTAIYIWNVKDGTLARKILLPVGDTIADLAFSPDNQTLAAGFESGKVQLWNIADGKELGYLQGWRVEFSPDGKLLATMPVPSAADQQVHVYDTAKGTLRRQWKGQDARFSSKGLLAVENQGAVRLMDIARGSALHAFNGKSAAFSQDGQSLAVLDRGHIKLYRVADGHLMQTLEGEFESISSMQFSPDGQTLASVGAVPMCPNCLTTPAAALWKISDGKRVPLEIQNPLWVTFAPNQGTLVVGSVDAIYFLNPEDASTVEVFDEYATSVEGIAFSPDGKFLAANSGQPNLTVRVWQVEDSQLAQTMEDPNNPGYGTSQAAYSPDGRILAAQGSFRGAADGETLTDLSKALQKEAPPYIPSSVAFSPDGKSLAIGYLEGHLQLWDWGKETLIRKLEGFGGEVVSLAFSADGKTLASVFGYPDNAIQLWTVPEGKRLLSLKGAAGSEVFTRAVFSPDGIILMTVANRGEGMDKGIVELWQVEDGKRVLQLNAQGLMDATFSPDGTILATGSYDHTVRLWQAADGALLSILRGHGDYVTDLTFSPSGESLASSSYDGTVILWGLPSQP